MGLRNLRLFPVTLLLALGTTAPAAPPEKPRGVLLVTIDTWRWEYLGAAGETKVRTPNLDRLAAGGAYLPRVHAVAPLTAPSHASILTGVYPYRHGIRDNFRFRLDTKTATLTELFRRKGYETAAFVSSPPLRRAIGLDRGFSVYDDRDLTAARGESFVYAERRADETSRRAIGWLASMPPARPLFLWVHYFDPHQPYRSGPSATVSGPRSEYAGEVEFVDRELGRLLAALESRYALSVIVTGDHGEGLGEHGEATHGNALYETTLSVPLVLWPKPPRFAATRTSPVSLVDLAPTVAEWMGLGPMKSDGRSLLAPEPAAPRWIYGESLAPTLSFGVTPAYALRRGDEVALLHAATEVYDTGKDPDQTRDAAPTSTPFVAQAKAELARVLRLFPEERIRHGSATAASAADVAKLRSLGYVGGSAATRAKPWIPEDRRVLLGRLNVLSRAQEDFTAGRLDAAAASFETFLKWYPDSAYARQQYGLALVRRNDATGAARQFSLALELDPDDPISSLSLGNLAAMKGDLPGARRLYERSLRADPDQTEAILNLVQILVALGDTPSARMHAARFLELAPNDPEAPGLRALVRGK